LSAADTFQPDVIVTDISMPRFNGIEAARLIIQKNPASRIILLTAHNDSALVEQGFSAGALGYVLKLKADEELSLAIRSALEDKRFISLGVSLIAPRPLYRAPYCYPPILVIRRIMAHSHL